LCERLIVSLYFIYWPACGKSFDPKVRVPPPEQVFKTGNTDLETVEKPEQFPLFAVDQARAGAQRNVTGTVNSDMTCDVSRSHGQRRAPGPQ
jgi:hypothetical protein